MTFLQIASLLIVLAGLFGAINYLFLKLPSAIGILVVSLAASLAVMGLDLLLPGLGMADQVRSTVTGIDFSDALLEGMLGLLLFAGALHVKISDLRQQWRVVILMATIGVALSTTIVGVGFSWLTGMPLLIALVFGALVSPTDPVAVLGVLREANLQKSLETKIAGESLFNDGVGYVVFLVLVGLAFPSGDAHHEPGFQAALLLFTQEALGGAVLGVMLGWLTFRLMRHIDDYSLEVLLTLGLAFGGYELAVALHVSAPIMAVCAGLLIGDVGAKHGMSEETRKYVDAFWKLIDEILNAVLFLMIGFEVFAVAFTGDAVMAGIFAIALALFARFAAVAVPVMLLKPFRNFSAGVIPIMTWGGLKGGISVALALSLPENEWKPLILTATYIIVIFSIIIQGLTVAPLATKLGREPELM
ncbi:Na(+)/H(+) antiporter NhaP [Aliiroseovarius sp. xm-m-379]|uniref:cation:proton antiporter n=1 Tax=unclassified Aliiroseovarius TaxID=2623558 RepID=UPI001569FEEE|nr:MULTISPECIES: sodium:proton antiporter [unclassified Aliiroseovarius]NRP11541.1 Na(+)/H(+) antiporter NhaP [Aliiroseovarius sp. xm-d-517]NRP25846.1 Na(+)/H(+) antiporter NhaP [Aliiroseovarius sp. xm-m-379]NRP34645.1 Na(+)/H(+) antiporter NhaP [Aliiroseovarius sp. xm-a-104]NRP42079.1 Na(+)/H(+) antiporter NhaP [Aliiroseovarius sp. xm-m-339-2]NRP44987.1 Na(+)/H(+) antiporter NhaP [Aliiroseovarius sp. xm-m-378]